MLLPLPGTYALVLNASIRGEWATITEYEGAGFGPAQSLRYAGILAVRGDVRIQVEWQCLADGRWERRHAEAAVRAAAHDPADWVKPHPLRWYDPASRDADRRCPVSGVHAAVRLLGYPDDALRSAVLARCSGRRALATQR
jgi:hypothetical protein